MVYKDNVVVRFSNLVLLRSGGKETLKGGENERENFPWYRQKITLPPDCRFPFYKMNMVKLEIFIPVDLGELSNNSTLFPY